MNITFTSKWPRRQSRTGLASHTHAHTHTFTLEQRVVQNSPSGCQDTVGLVILFSGLGRRRGGLEKQARRLKPDRWSDGIERFMFVFSCLLPSSSGGVFRCLCVQVASPRLCRSIPRCSEDGAPTAALLFLSHFSLARCILGPLRTSRFLSCISNAVVSPPFCLCVLDFALLFKDRMPPLAGVGAELT